MFEWQPSSRRAADRTGREQSPAGAGQAAPLDALHAHGRVRRTTRCRSSCAARAATSTTSNGKRYLDGLSALFCVNAGHGRAELGEAAARQAKELGFYTNWSYAHPRAIELAARIADLAPGDLNRVFFTSGGSEAVESRVEARPPVPPRPRRGRHATSSSRARPPTTAPRWARSSPPASPPLRSAVRAAAAGRLPRAEHEQLPLARGPRPALGGGRDRASGSSSRARRPSPP